MFWGGGGRVKTCHALSIKLLKCLSNCGKISNLYTLWRVGGGAIKISKFCALVMKLLIIVKDP